MKKYGLLKTLAILLLLVLVATYFISAGGNTVSFLAFKDGTASYLGLGDILISFIQSFYHFFDTIVFVLVVGAFYGVLNKVPVYKTFINTLASRLKKYGSKAIVVITVLFALVACFSGIELPLFIFVPFAVAVILSMGYDKLVAISSTIGGILIGCLGGLFTAFRDPTDYYSVSYQTFEGLVGLDNNFSNIIPKIVLLVLAIGLLIFYILRHIEKVNKKEVKYDLGEKIDYGTGSKSGAEKNKKLTVSLWPLIVLGGILLKYITIVIDTVANIPDTSFWIFNYASLCNVIIIIATVILIIKFGKSRQSTGVIEISIMMIVMLLLLVLGLTPWSDLFGTTVFDDIHTAVIENFTIPSFGIFSEYSILENLLSANFVAFGQWATLGSFLLPMIMVIVVVLVIKFVYRIKFDDILDGCIEGVKKALPAAILAAVAYTVLVCSCNSNFLQTIITAWDSNVVLQLIATIIGSVLSVDLYYTTAFVFSPILTVVTDYGNIMALAFQSLRGLVQLLAPTSLLLVVGLTYFSVPYKTWVKYIWKLVVSLFIIIFAILLVMALI